MRSLIIIICLLLLPNCSKRRYTSHTALNRKTIPIFISMPKNPLVFDNVSPLLYDALHEHYMRIGYTLTNNKKDSYQLDIAAKSLNQTHKMVSPDLLLLHNRITLELECKLFDTKNNVMCEKVFFFSTLLSKPKNPIMNSDFLDFEYKKLFRRSVPIIERYFRSYILKSYDQS